jgi:tetratricopeptide (TPR) repeat protein
MNGGSGSLTYYQRALAMAPDYFAVHHYLAHAYENIGQAATALPHARRFAQAAAAVPHAHHMYGHVLRQVNRMPEAIAEFKKADELHVANATAERMPPALDWHYRHNLDLLGTSYQYLGQMSRAEDVLRRSFELPSAGHLGHEQDINKRAWPLFLLARRRPADALTATTELQRNPAPLLQALGHVLASRILVATRSLDRAAAEGNVALRAMRAIGPEGGMLLPDFQLAQGEYLLRTGEVDKGRAMLQDAAKKLRAERGPDMWVATLFQLEAVAGTARELGEWPLAGQMAELMRQHDPAYAGTQYALGLAADHQGDAIAARAAFTRAQRQWQAADKDLPEMQDLRARVGEPPMTRPKP